MTTTFTVAPFGPLIADFKGRVVGRDPSVGVLSSLVNGSPKSLEVQGVLTLVRQLVTGWLVRE